MRVEAFLWCLNSKHERTRAWMQCIQLTVPSKSSAQLCASFSFQLFDVLPWLRSRQSSAMAPMAASQKKMRMTRLLFSRLSLAGIQTPLAYTSDLGAQAESAALGAEHQCFAMIMSLLTRPCRWTLQHGSDVAPTKESIPFHSIAALLPGAGTFISWTQGGGQKGEKHEHGQAWPGAG